MLPVSDGDDHAESTAAEDKPRTGRRLRPVDCLSYGCRQAEVVKGQRLVARRSDTAVSRWVRAPSPEGLQASPQTRKALTRKRRKVWKDL